MKLMNGRKIYGVSKSMEKQNKSDNNIPQLVDFKKVFENIRASSEEEKEIYFKEILNVFSNFKEEVCETSDKNFILKSKLNPMIDILKDNINFVFTQYRTRDLQNVSNHLKIIDNSIQKELPLYLSTNKMSLIENENIIIQINNLSSLIKKEYKLYKTMSERLNSVMDSISDQLIFTKGNLNEMYCSVNMNKLFSKTIREQLNNTVTKLDNLNELKKQTQIYIKENSQNFHIFYENAKDIFKSMKEIHLSHKNKENLIDTQKNNENYYFSPKIRSYPTNRMNNIPVSQAPRSFSKTDRLQLSHKNACSKSLSKTQEIEENLQEKNIDSLIKQNNEALLDINPIKHSKFLNDNMLPYQDLGNHIKNNQNDFRKKSQEINCQETIRGDFSCFPMSPTTQFNSNISSIRNIKLIKEDSSQLPLQQPDKINNNKLVSISQNILNFISQITSLQRSITMKLENVKEKKLEFERKKKQLIAQAEKYIEESSISLLKKTRFELIIKSSEGKETCEHLEEIKNLKELLNDLDVIKENLLKDKETLTFQNEDLRKKLTENGTTKDNLCTELMNKIKLLTKDKDNLSQEKNDLSTNLRTIQINLTKFQTANEELQSEINQLEKESNNFKQRSLDIERKIDLINKEKESLVDENSKLKEIIDTNKDNILKLNSINEENQNKILLKDERINNLMGEIKEIKNKFDEFESAYEDKIKCLTFESHRIKKELEEKINNLESINNEKDSTINKLNENNFQLSDKINGLLNQNKLLTESKEKQVIQEYRIEIEKLNSMLVDKSNESTLLSLDLKTNNEKLLHFEQAIHDFSLKVELLENIIKETNQINETLLKEKKENIEILDNLKKDLTKSVEVNQNFAEEITNIKRENTVLKADIQIKIEENSKLNKNLNQLSILFDEESIKLKSLNEKLILLSTEKENLINEINLLKISITNFEKDNEEKEKLKNLEEEKLSLKENEINNISKKLKEKDEKINFVQEQFEELKLRYENEAENMTIKIKEISLEREELLKKVEDLEFNFKQNNTIDYENKIKFLNNKYSNLEKDFKEFQEKNRQNQKYYADKNQILEKEKEKLSEKIIELTAKLDENKKEILNDSNKNEDEEENNELFFNKYESENYQIASSREVLGLKWFLLLKLGKQIKERIYSHSDFIWVTENDIFEEKLNRVEGIVNEEEKLKEQIEGLLLVQEKLMDKIGSVDTEKSKGSQVKPEVKGQMDKFISLDKYEVLIQQLNQETENYRKLVQNIEIIQKENEQYKKILEQNKEILEKAGGNNNNMSFIFRKETVLESKFIEDEDDINNLFVKSEGEAEQNNFSLNPNANEAKNNENSFMKQIVTTEKCNNPGEKEKKLSIHSIKTMKTDTIESKGKIEDYERLLSEQLTKVKEELKEIRANRDHYKMLYERSLPLKNEDTTEIFKQSLERLIFEMNINNKVKEMLTVILKMIDYNDEQIKDLLNKKKKNNFFSGLFGKK